MARSIRILALLVALLFLGGTFHGVVHHPGGLDHGCVLCMNPVGSGTLPPIESGIEQRQLTCLVALLPAPDHCGLALSVRWSRGPPAAA